jgi:hypothetical protein
MLLIKILKNLQRDEDLLGRNISTKIKIKIQIKIKIKNKKGNISNDIE